MASTVVLAETIAKALAECDPNRLADALRQYGFGMHLSPQKWTWLGSTGATAVQFGGASAGATAAIAFLASASPGPQTPSLPQNQTMLPPALIVGALRVTTGPSGSVGPYIITDAGGTPQAPQLAGPSGAQVLDVPGVAVLSDDGATLTFAEQVSGFVLQYIPRSAVNVLQLFEHS